MMADIDRHSPFILPQKKWIMAAPQLPQRSPTHQNVLFTTQQTVIRVVPQTVGAGR
jgi:hypothetical protein